MLQIQIFSSFMNTEFTSIADIVTAFPTDFFCSRFLTTTDSFDQVLLYIFFYCSILTDFIYTYIFSIVIITSISTIIVYSGAARNLGQKAGRILGALGTGASIYTGVRTGTKDIKNILEGDSKPSSSKPTDPQPVDNKPTDNKPSSSDNK